MNRTGITRRIEALEGKSSTEQSAIVRVPQNWSADRRQTAIAGFRTAAALPDGAPVDVKECDTATELEVVFAGCWQDVMDHAAKHGKRLGVPPAKLGTHGTEGVQSQHDWGIMIPQRDSALESRKG